jgi:hypothetical protein
MNQQTAIVTPEEIYAKWALFDPSKVERISSRVQSLLAQMDDRRDLIDAALAYTPGTHTYDQLVGMVLQGRLTFWPLERTFMLTEVHTFPNARHYHIFLAGGNMEKLVEMHPDVILLAKALGCDKLTLAGRPGWERALKAHGWNPYLVTLAKEI